MRIRTLIINLLVVSISVPTIAADWSAIFSGGTGVRMDYNPKAGGLKTDEDGASYLYRFDVPSEGSRAHLVLMYTKETEKQEPEGYDLEILQRSPEMLVLKARLNGGVQIDRFQIFTVYLKIGFGFCVTTSAFLTGQEAMRVLAASNTEIPAASANITTLFRVE